VLKFVSKHSFSGLDCHQLWQHGKTWKLCGNVSLVRQLEGKLLLIQGGMSATLEKAKL
jgi:hypothetical protein